MLWAGKRTLIRFSGDMQRDVQELLAGWRALETRLGFGVGIAMGPATAGRIGPEGRVDDNAVGNAVNLASRLSDNAQDNQILVDRVAAEAIGEGTSAAARCTGPEGLRSVRSRVRRERRESATPWIGMPPTGAS